MRLINVNTLQMSEFPESAIPPYAILSHRWGADEILLKDFLKNRRRESAGYKKVSDFCAFVRSSPLCSFRTRDATVRQLEWIWVDTCCIDKKSSSELSEAINSMYRWYSKATICVILLQDLTRGRGGFSDTALRRSDWFNRGWTLQELIAPASRVFVDSKWQVLGCINVQSAKMDGKSAWASLPDLTHATSVWTRIPASILNKTEAVQSASVAQRMSWASHRTTTREEDIAYSLLGIFEITMPLLYGEGGHAFQRLQEEIMMRSNDNSIFAWEDTLYTGNILYPLLAPAPQCFEKTGDVTWSRKTAWAYRMTNSGLEARVDLRKLPRDLVKSIRFPLQGDGTSFADDGRFYFIELNCDKTVGKWDIPFFCGGLVLYDLRTKQS